VTRKYKLTINNSIVDVEVDGPHNGVLTITIGEATFPVQVADYDTKSGRYQIIVGDLYHTVQLLSDPNASDFTLKVNRESYTVHLEPLTGSATQSFRPSSTSSAIPPSIPATQVPRITLQERTEPGTVTAPLPGRVLEVCIKEGAIVKLGDVLLVLEAMKMANEIRAPQDGTVRTVHVEVGTAVEKGQPMITIQ
jgi:biotin carboxyl carrier protein